MEGILLLTIDTQSFDTPYQMIQALNLFDMLCLITSMPFSSSFLLFYSVKYNSPSELKHYNIEHISKLFNRKNLKHDNPAERTFEDIWAPLICK